MFYSQFILAKKGPLGTIWIAAHLERKLRKNQVADTDIGVSVDSILFPEMPIALRLSSHLLLGVVRIYSRKVNYLFDDCSEALLKVKQAFRSTAVDLPPEESTAPYHSITLPETFDLDDFELPDNELFQGNYVDHHISSKDQITLQDTMEGVVYSTSKFGLDERFGDGDASGLDLDEELLVEKAAAAEHAIGTSHSDVDPQSSVQANESSKYNDNRDDLNLPEAIPPTPMADQHMDEYDGDSEPVEYAQAPCTPGLWEEPNLSNIQETSAFDDHQEPDNQILTESAVKENLQNASEQDLNQSEPPEKSPPHVVETEQRLVNDHGFTPFTESHSVEVSESVTAVSEHPEKLEELLNQNGVQIVEENRIEHQDMSNDIYQTSLNAEGNQENAFRITSELELNAEPAGEDNLNQDQAFSEPNNSTFSEFPTLKPCVTHLNHESISNKPADSIQTSEFTSQMSETPLLVQEEEQQATEAQKRNMLEAHLAELGLNDEDLNRQVEHEIVEDVQVNNMNNYTNDVPAPETMLSIPPGFADVPPPGFSDVPPPGFSDVPPPGFSDVPKYIVPESTPPEKDITTDTISGKKRSFTETSLTAQSFNLNESSGFYTTNQSVMGDDDLLSSILVGRKSSILKMKPTPPVAPPPTKRRRSANKSTLLKRKVLMDDNMVLHGDTIRQQLTNTGDIRRLRKKAPCTHSEISMLEKQFWEDELFSEPIFTGLSMKMAYLHNQSYDLSKIKIIVSRSDDTVEGETDPKLITLNDEKDAQVDAENANNEVYENIGVSFDPNVPKENVEEENFNAVISKNVSEVVVEPVEFPLVTENHTIDINTENVEYYENQQPQMESVGDVAEPSRSETEPFRSEQEVLGQGTEMAIDAKTYSDAAEITVSSVIPNEVELPTHADVAPTDGFATSAPLNEVDVPGVNLNEQMDLNASATFTFETDGYRPEIGTIDENVEVKNNEEEIVNEGTDLGHVERSAQDLVNNELFGEEFETVAAYGAEGNPVWGDVPLDEKEMPAQQANVEEDIPLDNKVDDEEFTYDGVGNDTDFLNFDDVDDDEVDAADDYMPDGQPTRVIDNSGWSSRTKAVAKYLQIMFDKEGERGRTMLPVNNLLIGKTRKEASRMFFETLVLKTKDYIHVEQADPYDNINVFPRAKLLKSDF